MVNGMLIPRSKRHDSEGSEFAVSNFITINYSTTFNPSMFANFSGFDFLRAVSTFRERKKNSCLVLKHDV